MPGAHHCQRRQVGLVRAGSKLLRPPGRGGPLLAGPRTSAAHAQGRRAAPQLTWPIAMTAPGLHCVRVPLRSSWPSSATAQVLRRRTCAVFVRVCEACSMGGVCKPAGVPAQHHIYQTARRRPAAPVDINHKQGGRGVQRVGTALGLEDEVDAAAWREGGQEGHRLHVDAGRCSRGASGDSGAAVAAAGGQRPGSRGAHPWSTTHMSMACRGGSRGQQQLSGLRCPAGAGTPPRGGAVFPQATGAGRRRPLLAGPPRCTGSRRRRWSRRACAQCCPSSPPADKKWRHKVRQAVECSAARLLQLASPPPVYRGQRLALALVLLAPCRVCGRGGAGRISSERVAGACSAGAAGAACRVGGGLGRCRGLRAEPHPAAVAKGCWPGAAQPRRSAGGAAPPPPES